MEPAGLSPPLLSFLTPPPRRVLGFTAQPCEGEWGMWLVLANESWSQEGDPLALSFYLQPNKPQQEVVDPGGPGDLRKGQAPQL